jgi:hypothetical protein
MERIPGVPPSTPEPASIEVGSLAWVEDSADQEVSGHGVALPAEAAFDEVFMVCSCHIVTLRVKPKS